MAFKEYPDHIFVYGANEAGRHGAGAALWATKNRGARNGKIKFYGQSYGIPTKDKWIMTLPLDKIKPYVDEFIEFAKEHPELKFQITPIGCGLAGYKPEQIAPMFKNVPNNCLLPEEFVEILNDKSN